MGQSSFFNHGIKILRCGNGIKPPTPFWSLGHYDSLATFRGHWEGMRLQMGFSPVPSGVSFRAVGHSGSSYEYMVCVPLPQGSRTSAGGSTALRVLP